jgi:hypothetical protein
MVIADCRLQNADCRLMAPRLSVGLSWVETRARPRVARLVLKDDGRAPTATPSRANSVAVGWLLST